MARPQGDNQVGHLYFIHSDEQQAIKVGFTDNVYMRLKSLQTGNPHTLSLTGSVSCTYAAEKAFHRMMKPHSIRLEWYPDNELMFALENEIQDFALDRAVIWLADTAPDSSGEDVLTDALKGQFLTAEDMDEIVTAVLEDVA